MNRLEYVQAEACGLLGDAEWPACQSYDACLDSILAFWVMKEFSQIYIIKMVCKSSIADM